MGMVRYYIVFIVIRNLV